MAFPILTLIEQVGVMASDLYRAWRQTVRTYAEENPNWAEKRAKEQEEGETSRDEFSRDAPAVKMEPIDNLHPEESDANDDGGLEEEDLADNPEVEDGDVPGPLGGGEREGGPPLGFHYGHLGIYKGYCFCLCYYHL